MTDGDLPHGATLHGCGGSPLTLRRDSRGGRVGRIASATLMALSVSLVVAATLLLGACSDDTDGDADGGSGGVGASGGAGGVGASGGTGGVGASGGAGGIGVTGGAGGATGGVGGGGAIGGAGGDGASGGVGGNGSDGTSGGAGGNGGDSGGSGNGDVDAGNIIDCDARKVICKVAVPDCEEGKVPRVIGTCYSGDCVDITECVCDEPAACPNNDKYTCLNFSQKCSPYL